MEPKPLLPRRIWLILAVGLSFPLFANLAYFIYSPSETTARVAYGLSKGFMVFWAVLCGIWLLPVRHKASEQPTKRLGWSLGIGAALGLAIIGLIVILMQTPLGAVVEQGGDAVRDKLDHMGFTKNFLLTAILLSVVHAAFEEFYWRWFAFGTLQYLSIGIWAHIIAGIAFAGHHFVILGAYFSHAPWLVVILGSLVGVGGVLWSLLREHTGTLIGSWLSHMIVDFGIMWVGWRLLNSA